MADFQIGDLVCFVYDGGDVYGTVYNLNVEGYPGYLYIIGMDGDLHWAVQAEQVKLINRPMPTDNGAIEYEEIMKAQELANET